MMGWAVTWSYCIGRLGVSCGGQGAVLLCFTSDICIKIGNVHIRVGGVVGLMPIEHMVTKQDTFHD